MGITAELLALPPDHRWAWFTDQSAYDQRQVFQAFKESHGTPWAFWRDDPAGFVKHALGEFLWSSQNQILTDVRDHRRVAVPATAGPGKALRDGTPVLTPDGWVPIEKLNIGDQVIAGDGTPTFVRGVWPQGHRPLYRVTFNDKATIDCDEDHLWTTLARLGPEAGQVHDVVSTRTLLDAHGPAPKGDHRTRIPLVAPVQFQRREVSIDAYTLGVLLGDANLNRRSVQITAKNDPWLIDQLVYPTTRVKGPHCNYVVRGGAGADLDQLGLLGLHSATKFVPDDYLWNDEPTRRGILAGLLDTDGTVDAHNSTVEYSSSSSRLAESVQFLVQSLGGVARITSRIPHYTYKGEKHTGQVNYRVFVTMPVNPFRLPRKAALWDAYNAKRHTATQRLIVGIEPVEAGQATCITVAHLSGTYVADQFVVTHNTHVAARAAAWFVAVHRPGDAQVVTTAPTFRQVRGLLWPHIRELVAKNSLPGFESCNQVEWQIGTHIAAFGFAPNKYDEAAGQGIHAEELLVVVDEAGGIEQRIGDNLDALLTSEGSRIFAIGNPPVDEQGTWFEQICSNQQWHTLRIGAYDTPNMTGEKVPAKVSRRLTTRQWVDEVTEKHGEDSNWVQAKVYARFPTGSSTKVIPREWIDRVVDDPREWPTRDGEPAMEFPEARWQRLGVDIASDGGDEMVIAHFDGPFGKIVHTSVAADNSDQYVVAGKILDWILQCEAIQRTNGYTKRPVRVKVDVIGVGRGAYDLLVRWGKPGNERGDGSPAHSADIVPVNFGALPDTAEGKEEFLNQRAEAWWAMRETIRGHEIWLDVEDKEVIQLNGPKYGSTAAGKTQIEKKKDVAARIGGSPDRADALVLGVYEPVQVVATTVFAPPPVRKTISRMPATRR